MASGNSTRHNSRFIDLAGQRFGKWTVLEYSGRKGSNSTWLCRCDCGKLAVVISNNLSCERATCSQYHNYGGRGINVCEGWHSFEVFYVDMGPCPSPAYSLDRIDNNGNYSCGHCAECLRNGWPANCRWATKSEQGRNMRSNRFLTFNGITQTTTDWAKQLGVKAGCINSRLWIGWSVERALGTPFHKRS